MMKVSKRAPETLGIPRGVAQWAEKIGSHVVVDPVHLPLAIGKNETTSLPIRPLEPVTRIFFMDDSLQ